MPPPTDPPEGARFDFFFYGTLCDADVRAVVLGRKVDAAAATLDDHEAVPVEHGRFPILQFQRGRQARGVLCQGLGLVEAARLSYFEREAGDYDARQLRVRVGDGDVRQAWVYVPTTALRRGAGRWDLAEWQRFAKRDFLTRAERAMRALEPKQLEPYVKLWTPRVEVPKGAGRSGQISRG